MRQTLPGGTDFLGDTVSLCLIGVGALDLAEFHFVSNDIAEEFKPEKSSGTSQNNNEQCGCNGICTGKGALLVADNFQADKTNHHDDDCRNAVKRFCKHFNFLSFSFTVDVCFSMSLFYFRCLLEKIKFFCKYFEKKIADVLYYINLCNQIFSRFWNKTK